MVSNETEVEHQEIKNATLDEKIPQVEPVPQKKNQDKKEENKVKKVKKKKNKVILETPKKSILKKDKKVSFDDSTDIQTINSQNQEGLETYNIEEANKINLTLESLENLQLDIENIEEANSNIPRRNKKMEDEYSDIGSELDLAKFEDSITQSS